ncbi:MAG: hypothetical protein ABWY06_12700 [Pseudomonas sp.]|uniref:hypothetical protein n=1 Tax=Pseudomonas sp. TaxID=306 RepID=UPI00339B7EB7
MRLNNLGIFLSCGAAVLVVLANLYFYNQRCAFSPTISVAGVFIGFSLQAVFLLSFASLLGYSAMTARAPRENRLNNLKMTTVFIFGALFLGGGISHQALLRSDAMKSRGASSVGDVCLFSSRAAPTVETAVVTSGAELLKHEQTSQPQGSETLLYPFMQQALLQPDRQLDALSHADYQDPSSIKLSTTAPRDEAGRTAIRVLTIPGRPVSPAAMAQLIDRFGALPENFMHWFGQQAGSVLLVRDADSTQQYRVFSPEEALERHAELMGWLHLHDDSAPEMSKDIFAMLGKAGIDPAKMLPIVGSDGTPDCFVMRLDGEYRGHIYFWSHEQIPRFEPITANAVGLLEYLIDRARAGDIFVL